eukprot:PhF_6_TR31237/c0_g1_i1/m.45784/K08486/STX1B_2_3; syntaxin 1B/2/3
MVINRLRPDGSTEPTAPNINTSTYSCPETSSVITIIPPSSVPDSFYEAVTNIQNALQTIVALTHQCHGTFREMIHSASKEMSEKCKVELDEITETVQKHSVSAKNDLKSIDEMIAKAKTSKGAPNDVVDDTALRIMQNQLNFLLKKFLANMKSWNDQQTEHYNKSNDIMNRKIDTLARNPDGSIQTIDREAFLDSMTAVSYGQDRHKLEEILETRNDVVKIEKSLRELEAVFLDLGNLIFQQSAELDDIHQNMKRANVVLQRSTVVLQTVRKKWWKRRRNVCICTLFVVMVVAGVAVAVFIVV